MIKNYLKITIRNIKKHKAYAAINILGLASGIACSLFIVLYVQLELSYDRYHPDADRIFRVAKSRKSESKLDKLAANVTDVAPTLKERFPEVEEAARASDAHLRYIKVGENKFLHEKMILLLTSI